jgi:hypothetical protein
VVIESVITDDFVLKHPDFSLRLANRLQEYRNLVDKENVSVMNEFADTMSEQVAELKQGTLTETAKIKSLPEKEVFLERVDEYYLNFMRLRKIGHKELNTETQTDGERLAEDAMIADLRILEPHYYPDYIRGLVGDKVEVPYGLLDEETVKSILKKAKLSLEDEEVEKVLKKARYKVLDVIYDVQHNESERLLKRELIASLHMRGYSDEDFELVKNEKSGKYEVIMN